MPEGWAYAAGRIVPLAKAQVPLLDRGHLLGDGVFETLRTVRGEVLFRARHLARLRRGLTALGISKGISEATEALDLLTAKASTLGPLRVRLQVTTGTTDGLLLDGSFAVTGTARPFTSYPWTAYDPGVRVVVGSPMLELPHPLGGAKSTSFQGHARARRQAELAGADDAIILNVQGRPCEATTSNLLVRRGRSIYAPGPDEGAVDGVTRAWALARLRKAGVAIRPSLTLDDVGNADEVLLLNVIAGIRPVVRIRGWSGPLAGPHGETFRSLHAAWEGLVASPNA